ncbi:reverse transcriptase domain-containing protein [Tanacetum coccineum]|uniref:Reverse transcriptase domain-containing protein n=1 Tax=Tanacetum coccineum TaxID=301880 RepID=A0ABQ5B535_9ASTR
MIHLSKRYDDYLIWNSKPNDGKNYVTMLQLIKAECFDQRVSMMEIDAFLCYQSALQNIEESCYDSEGDIIYLESLLSDDNTHNLFSGVFFDHEPQHIKNESDHDTLITFSPKNDPLHHEFAGGVITIPPRIVRKHEDYISRMSLLCGNSSSRSPENFHTIIESLPTSTTLKRDIIDNLLNDDPIPDYERLTFDMEPDVPVINNVYELNEDECFDPGGGEINVEVDDSFTFVIRTFLPYLTYPELNEATRKDHFPLPFMDQMLERLAGNEYYCFLDGFSGYFQIPINPHDQEKTTFTCPYGTFAYRRMPFGLCNAPGTFQRCMMAIFHDMIEKMMEVFMDDFLVFRNSFKNCLSRVDKMLQRCEDTNLCLNWEKSHFMVKEGIVLGHKISKKGIEVDKAKVDVIAKLPHPTTVKGVQSFLGHVGFYRRFIKDFSKISRPMTHLLEKNTPFIFSDDCIQAFQTLKKKLTEAPILITPD